MSSPNLNGMGIDMITLEDIKAEENFKIMIHRANEYLSALGYTEHGTRHVTLVARTTAYILEELCYDQRTIELGAIAGYLHDIGNMHNRKYHGPTGANIVFNELRRIDMPMEEICRITTAIGNHEEEIGKPVSPITSALIIADKSDAHRTRVNKIDAADIHDRVNHAIINSDLIVNREGQMVTLDITFDQDMCQIMDYFTIYLKRMELCKQAANFLNCRFQLLINDLELLGNLDPAKITRVDPSRRAANR